mmetsp:Transcript_140223/g.436081  ORF Transcript_140223/g.436081 Transcript_140223/m.436081 type:complete len:369 (-) Transcript_140223:21-1127(-)
MRPRPRSQPLGGAPIRFPSLAEIDDLKYWLTLLKVFVVLLWPSVAVRLVAGDFWGGLNASAGPVIGIFLLKDEDPRFALCYEYLSRIWLVNECCGVQRSMSFTYTLSIFMLINLVNGLLDAYQFVTSGFDTDTPIGVALSACLGSEVACVAVCVQIQKAIRLPPPGSQGAPQGPLARGNSRRLGAAAAGAAQGPLSRSGSRRLGRQPTSSLEGRRRRESAPASVFAGAVAEMGQRRSSGRAELHRGDTAARLAWAGVRRPAWLRRSSRRPGGVELDEETARRRAHSSGAELDEEVARLSPGRPSGSGRESDDSDREPRPSASGRLRSWLQRSRRSLPLPGAAHPAREASGERLRRSRSRGRPPTPESP